MSISTEIHSESLAPKVTDPEVRKLLPTTGEHPILHSVIIRGINTAVANGLRRILMTEMGNLALRIDDESWECDDPFVLTDMIARRILNIPIVQREVREGDQYVFAAVNDSDDTLDVYSRTFRATRAHSRALPFFDTFVILTLQPRRHIKFTATVVSGNSYADAVFATCNTVAAIPLDERVLDPVTKAPPVHDAQLPLAPNVRYFESSAMTDPRDFLLKFTSCGKGDTKSLMKRAVTTFIERIARIKDANIVEGPPKTSHDHSSATVVAHDMMQHQVSHIYHIVIPNETRTIGELFVRCALDIFPRLNFAGNDTNRLTNELIICFRSHFDEPKTVIKRTVDFAQDMLSALLRHF